VDYHKLPDAPELEAGVAGGEVRTEIELQLIDIWRASLRLDSLGVHDNFFFSGGDSLLALRVCARAVEAGLPITLNDMFAHQTVYRLASVIETRGASHKPNDEAGPVPLNVSQQFFLESNPDSPDHFNISSFFELRTQLSDLQWREAAAAVRNNHDSLRLRITDADGQWSAEVLDHSDVATFARIDLRGLPQEEQDRRMREESRQWQTKLSIREARLFQLVLFELGPERYDRLLAIVHHLAADGSSVPILLESLERAVRGIKNRQELGLQKPSCSWRHWVSTLKALASSPEIMQDMTYWVRPERMRFHPIPRDHKGDNIEQTTKEIIRKLNTVETDELLEAAHRFGSNVAETVLSAVVAGAGQWAQASFLNIDWIAHGREPIRSDLEVSRTTGYFSLRIPIVIENGDKESAAELLPSICESLRTLPRGGLSYGMLRYMHEDPAVRKTMSRTPQPEISFNYLGDFDFLRPATEMLVPLDISTGVARAGTHRRPCLIQVFASKERRSLQLLWRYNTAIHDQVTIEGLAERTIKALRGLASASSPAGTQCVGIPS
jgi:non-ribosomal peptide synthase protein (TIGR01720 family)